MGFLEKLFSDMIANESSKPEAKQPFKVPSKQTAQCVRSAAGRDNNTNSYTIINEIHISY